MTPERAIEVLGGVRANAASLASGISGYRYGGESGVDIANACIMAIKELTGSEGTIKDAIHTTWGMTRFSRFTDDELNMMEEAFCNEGLKYLVDEIRIERRYREGRK